MIKSSPRKRLPGLTGAAVGDFSLMVAASGAAASTPELAGEKAEVCIVPRYKFRRLLEMLCYPHSVG